MFKRTVSLFLVFCLLMIGLVTRVLSIKMDPDYTQAAAQNHGVTLTVDTCRGNIYDCNMNLLTNEEQRFFAAIKPTEAALEALPNYVTGDEMPGLVKRLGSGFPVVTPTHRAMNTGTDITILAAKKRYGAQPLAAHIIGYLSGETGKGQSGIEKAYDNWLDFGGTLKARFSADAYGRALQGAAPEVLRDGYDSKQGVKLTLDTQVQKILESVTAEELGIGSIVVVETATGKIRGLLSRPDIDPGDLAKSLKGENSPFLNRSLTAYTLGSIFKVVVAAAALEAGISPSFSYTCTGKEKVGDREFHCHKETGHGTLQMEGALADSCNTYFIALAQRVGAKRILDMASSFGLGYENQLAPGLVSDAGQLPTLSTLSIPGQLANFAFGQGDLLATPLQTACLIATVANGGKYYKPSLVEGLISSDGKLQNGEKASPPVLAISKETAQTLRSFLITTVNQGSGSYAKPAMAGAGGKTATAQSGWYLKNGEEVVHTWFAGFYPAEVPKYSVTIMTEYGASGSRDCGPIFKKIADALHTAGLA